MFSLKNKIQNAIFKNRLSIDSIYYHQQKPRACINIGVIGVPFWYGQSKLGTNQAPDMLRSKGLISKLNGIKGNIVVDFGNVQLGIEQNFTIDQSFKKKQFNPNEYNLLQMYLKSSQFIENLIKNDFVPLILGGDHSVAVGSVMGTYRATANTNDDLSLIWIDAHADACTVQNSLSGNLHGMPVSFLVKDTPGKHSFQGEIKPCLSAKNIVFIGLRDVEIQELKLLKDLNIAYFSMRDVDKLGMSEVIARALDLVDPLNKNKLHVSFDVDSVDNIVIPSTGTPVLGGLTIREAFLIAEHIGSSGKMVALDLVEFNPNIGSDWQIDQSAKHIIDIILMFFGKSRLGYFSVDEESSY